MINFKLVHVLCARACEAQKNRRSLPEQRANRQPLSSAVVVGNNQSTVGVQLPPNLGNAVVGLEVLTKVKMGI